MTAINVCQENIWLDELKKLDNFILEAKMQKKIFIMLKMFITLYSLIYVNTAFGRIEGTRDAMVVNNSAYVVNAWQGVDIINVSEPSNFSIVGHVSINNPISVKVVGDYAYIVGSISVKNPMDVRVIEEAEYVNGGLYIVNISDPNNPYIVGQTNVTLGLPYGIDVVGNYAYITEIELPSRGYTSGLTIYDISNKTSPIIVGHIATHNPSGVKVVDNYAYVADQPGGLKIVNIANPSNPTLVGNITTSCAVKVDIVGNYAYVADATAGIKIFNIANPEFPILVGNITTNNARDIKVIDNYALVADYTAGVKIFDISNPQDPVLVKSIDAAESQGVTVFGNYVYVSAGTAGLITIDLSNSSSTASSFSSSLITGTASSNVALSNEMVTNSWSPSKIITIISPISAATGTTLLSLGHIIHVNSPYLGTTKNNRALCQRTLGISIAIIGGFLNAASLALSSIAPNL